ALTDPSGAVLFSMLYDAWGNLRTDAGLAYGKYRYTGAEMDAATGLYHMGARFYDPTVGRWLSEDLIQDMHFDPASLNFYAYATANPLRFTDPDGASIQDQVLEWLKNGADYAKAKLKEFYEKMVEAYRALEDAAITVQFGMITVLAMAFMFQGRNMGTPGMPDAGSAFGQLTFHLVNTQQGWKVLTEQTAKVVSREFARRGATESVKIVFQRLSDGAIVGYHMFRDQAGRVIDAHFRKGTLKQLLEWLTR
ncbi:MAG: RHS repeat-associated core domain-containing protein, partial [bacterium]